MTRKHSKKHCQWNSENIVLKLGASQMTQIHEKKKSVRPATLLRNSTISTSVFGRCK